MARDSKGRFTAGIEISVIDSTLGPLRRIANSFKGIEGAGKKASRAFDVGNLDTLGREAIGLIEKPIKKFSDFQKTMSEVRAKTFKGDITAGAQAEFTELTEAARQLGASTSFSASEAAGGMVNLATAGFTAQEQLASMAGVLDLAKAGNESIANSGEIGANVLRGFGLEAAEMGRVGDVMVNTFTSSATTLADLGESMKMVSKNARDAGLSIEVTTAAIGVLGDVGIKGTMAGTALRATLLRLQAPDKKAKSALDFLGLNTKDKAGNLRPFAELMTDMNKAMDRKFGAGKGGTRRASLMKTVFGEEAITGASTLMEAAGSGKLQKLIAANEAADGIANKIALDMGNNAAGAAAELDSAFEELQLTVGEELTPAFTDILKGTKDVTMDIAAWAKENPELTRTLGALAVALGVVATATKAVTFALMMNPIVAIITGIATAAYLIYEYWGPISEFFTGLWDSVTETFRGAMEGILDELGVVGEGIRSARASVLDLGGAEDAGSEAAVVDRALAAGLGEDDLDTSLTGRGGTGDRSGDLGAAGWGINFNDQAANKNEKEGLDQLEAWAGVGAYEQYGPAQVTPAEVAAKKALDEADFAAAMSGMEQRNLGALDRPTSTGKALMGPAQGKPLMAANDAPAWDPRTGGKSEMVITVKGDPTVVKTEVRETDPNFGMRMNAGGQ